MRVKKNHCLFRVALRPSPNFNDRPDAGDEWLVILGPDGVTVSRRHAKGDLALRGAVGDLELVLYGRPPVASVERFGDESVLGAWYEAFELG